MKKTTLLTLMLVVALIVCSTVILAFAADTESRTADTYFEIYSSDPEGGASPVYTENASSELASQLQRFVNAGDTWIVLHSDVTVTFSAIYQFQSSLYIDLNGHTLTLGSSNTDRTFSPCGAQGQVFEIKNGTLTSAGAKLVYPIGENAKPDIRFTNLVIDVTADVSDYRAGGWLTFDGCEINFTQNYSSSATCNRFIFFGQRNGIGEINVEVRDTVFNVSPSFKWTNGESAIFNFSNKYANKTNLIISGSTFNMVGSALPRFLINANNASADVNISDTEIYGEIPFLTSTSSALTSVTVGDGVVFNKKGMDASTLNSTTGIGFPDEYYLVWHDNANVEYVAPENVVNVSYYDGSTKLGEKLSKIGAKPYWDIDLGLRDYMLYSDGVLYSAATGYFDSIMLDKEAAVITKDTTAIYIGIGLGEPCKWAAFSSETPSLETLSCWSSESNEIIDGVEDNDAVLIEGYGDISLTFNTLYYALSRNLVIDAKGNELNLSSDNTDKAFNPQTGATLTIKNATVVSDIARFGYPGAKPTNVSTSIILDNVKTTWSAITMFDYRAGGSFVARNCEFAFDGDATYAFNLLQARTDMTLDMSFVDCKIKTGGLKNSFISVATNANNCTVNISFDGCTIDAPSGPAIIQNRSTASTLNVKINCTEGANPTYIKTAVPVVSSAESGTTALTVGKGVYLNSPLDGEHLHNVTPTYLGGARVVNAASTEYPYAVTDDFVTVTFNNGGNSYTEAYEMGYVGTLNSSKIYSIVNENGVNKVAEQQIAWRDELNNLVSTFVPADGMVLNGTGAATGNYATWAIFNSTETEIISHSLLDGSSADKLPASLATLLPEGGVLRLYADVTYTVSGSGMHNITLAKNSTVDLGGYTLKMTDARFMNSASEGYGFTVKNGTLDVTAAANNILYSNIAAKGHSAFIGVTFVAKDGVPPFDVRGGGLYLTDCKYEGTAQFLALSSRYTVGAPIYVVIDGCDIKSADFLSVNGSLSGNPTPPYTPDIDVIVNDTDVECSYMLMLNGAITEDSVVDLVFDGVRVKSNAASLVYMGVDATVNASFTNSVFSHNPLEYASGFGFDGVLLPDGLSVIQTDSIDYPYEIGVPVFLKWNMLLHNDVKINLYLSGEKINYVRLNGVDCPLDGLKETEKGYLLSVDYDGINRCAEEFDIEVGYGDGYSVSYTRSVVDYARSALESVNTEYTKRLVAAAMGYIYAAYNYAAEEDMTSPEPPSVLSSFIASDIYLAYAPTGDVSLDGGEAVGELALAIRSAQLSLGSAIKFRFNLRDGYTGTVTVGGESFDIVDGMNKRTGHTYIEVEANAFTLVGTSLALSGIAADGTAFAGEYSLAAYLNAVKGNCSETAGLLLDAIAAYSLAARDYKAECDMLDGMIYEKRGNSYAIVGVKKVSGMLVIPEIYNGFYVTEIEAYAFLGNTEITGVVIPKTVKAVGIGAFMNCTSLSSLTLSEGIEVIGARAFEGTAVEMLVIPDSTLAIGMGAFEGCNSLKSVTLPFVGAYRADSNNYFGYIFGAPSYVANGEYVPASLKTVIFSDNATRVPAYSFWGCSEIEEIVLGRGASFIGISAFSGCAALTNVYIPATVTDIPAAGYFYNSPFYGCSQELVIVTESSELTAFGRYWNNLTETVKAQIVSGMTYEEYVEHYRR